MLFWFGVGLYLNCHWITVFTAGISAVLLLKVRINSRRHVTLRPMSAAPGFIKTVMVLLESTAGSGHRIVAFRPKLATGRKEKIAFDPLVQQDVLYREVRKIRSLRKASS
ncbi:hypothetical protein FBUS_10223 [Fasciolopsis buskii]|uniref:Ribosomal protein L33 n=1 Tax=Fasciolopsis buskii TaxID=27845 RepID=A0A8E0S5C1_9TREM|nr:hypothetical protein FBUS_10223 [Fasciolopsis buski]